MRLQKYIASCGVASRRKAEEFIEQGRVKVNGKVADKQGIRVGQEDSVKIDNKRIRPVKKIYIVLNKPEKTITAVKDDRGRAAVTDILPPKLKKGVFPVGRLDFNTTGCLILTNDGDWANKVMHPSFEVEKKYIVKVKGRIPAKAAAKIKKGSLLDGKKVKPVKLSVIPGKKANDRAVITIKEGINHQVKRMFKSAGVFVTELKRESVGVVNIRGLAPGQWRHLTAGEINFFRSGQKIPARKKGG